MCGALSCRTSVFHEVIHLNDKKMTFWSQDCHEIGSSGVVAQRVRRQSVQRQSVQRMCVFDGQNIWLS